MISTKRAGGWGDPQNFAGIIEVIMPRRSIRSVVCPPEVCARGQDFLGAARKDEDWACRPRGYRCAKVDFPRVSLRM